MGDFGGFDAKTFSATIRFIQGYRYLDRCGEAVIQLERVLESGWIPGELTPASGNLKNDQIGMVAQFNSEAMTVRQEDVISFDLFRDQCCKIYDVLRSTFEIETVNAPTLRIIFQLGFEDPIEADDFIRGLGLCEPRPELVSQMGGAPSALSFTFCTEQSREWHNLSVLHRCRLNATAISQIKQPPFDERLVKRIRLLPQKQQEAMQALMRLRRQTPQIKPAAAQFDYENSFETELRASMFDLSGFQTEFYESGLRLASTVHSFKKRK